MMCETYPNMKLVLCHSARGFNMHHVIDSIEQLIGLDNLYFDTVSHAHMFSRDEIGAHWAVRGEDDADAAPRAKRARRKK